MFQVKYFINKTVLGAQTGLISVRSTSLSLKASQLCFWHDVLFTAFITEDYQNLPTLCSPGAIFHPLPTCSNVGCHQSELGLVLFLRHIVEGPAQVVFGLGQPVKLHLQPCSLSDDLRVVVALVDPDAAVRRVGISLALKEDQLTRVDGEHPPCPKTLVRVHLQVVGAVCGWVGTT